MLKKFFGSDLGKGSFILFITINAFNFLNFLFHFAMGRMLGPVDYGTLAVLMSIIYIYSIPSEAIQSLISKYTSTFNSKKEYGKIKYLILKSLNKSLVFSFVLFCFLAIFSVWLSNFLDISYWLIILINVFIFVSFLSPIVRGSLQGKKQFKELGISLVVESLIKLVLAIIFVLLGLKIVGATFGLLIGAYIALLIGFYFNKDVLNKSKIKTEFNNIYSKSFTYFVVMFIVFLAFGIDVILAKRFFSPEIAGQYAVVSMIGKIIFLGTSAIGKAMFPLTSEKDGNKNESYKIFLKSFKIIFILCFVACICFFIFPKLIIWILYGSEYLTLSNYLIYLGVSFSFLAFTNLTLIYGLSINKIKHSFILFFPLIVEIILLFVFNSSIFKFILTFMFCNIVIFIFSLLFLRKWIK